jgi:flagellar biosynthesis GTPase FlhF
MTEEQRTEIASLLGLAATTKKVVATTKKSSVPAARKAAVAAPLPEPDEDGVPSAASYRMKEEDIDHAVCVGRVLKGGEDKRWAPAVYREFQCGKSNEDGCDICKTCQARLEKYADDPKFKDWNGRVTEPPHAGVHMLGTEWADARKPTWKGEGAAASDSGSEASSSASSKKEVAEAAKEAAKATKEAEKEAAKAAKEAEKEAAKATKAAEREAKKEAKAAEKAAEKEAKAAEKAAAKKEVKKEVTKKEVTAKPAAKKEVKEAKKAVADAPAKADTAAAAAEVEVELKLIEGEIFAVKGKNVYQYDDDSEEAGDFVGRLTADETIDRDASEKEEED